MAEKRAGEDWVEVRLKPSCGSLCFVSGLTKLKLEGAGPHRIPKGAYNYFLKLHPNAPLELVQPNAPASKTLPHEAFAKAQHKGDK